MSDTFGRLGGIAIHQDIAENLENPANRKTRRDEASGKMPANKRAALGTITNSSRIQPFRAAKLVGPPFCSLVDIIQNLYLALTDVT